MDSWPSSISRLTRSRSFSAVSSSSRVPSVPLTLSQTFASIEQLARESVAIDSVDNLTNRNININPIVPVIAVPQLNMVLPLHLLRIPLISLSRTG
jgi:hypothetical protein